MLFHSRPHNQTEPDAEVVELTSFQQIDAHIWEHELLNFAELQNCTVDEELIDSFILARDLSSGFFWRLRSNPDNYFGPFDSEADAIANCRQKQNTTPGRSPNVRSKN